MNRPIVSLFALATVAFRSSHGQDVTGTIRDSVTGVPVRGAVVMVLAPNREPITRGLSSSSGAFRLSTASGAFFRVIRIGYHPFEVSVNRLGSSPISISMMPAGRVMAPISVRANPVCPRRSDQREALAMWSSATDALLAMVVAATEASQGGTVTQLLYNRLLSNDGRRIVRQSTRLVDTHNAAPIRADRDPAEFVRHGYVVRRGNVTTYYGPDPEVLLDSSFAATHCLSIRNDSRAHPGEAGVAFTPTRERDSIPDISGVLWITRAPMALRSMTFEYRGVDQAILDVRAGGRLDFETMSSGVPIIRSWHVRSPKLRYLPSGRTLRGRVVVDGAMADAEELHETGGLIVEGRLVDGTTLSAPLATLGGRVMNARTDEPVPGAVVMLDSTDLSAIADVNGQFSFEGVLPGPYTIRVRDSVVIATGRVDSPQQLVLDSNIQQTVRRIATMPLEARVGRVSPVDVQLPWWASVGGCGPVEAAERRFLVMGVVLTADSLPIPNAKVRLRWDATSRESTSETIVDAVADEGGGFFMCGIPAGIPLRTHIATPAGAEYDGTTTVSRVDYDEKGRRREGTLRAIKLVVSPP